jgi:hypothetical protein
MLRDDATGELFSTGMISCQIRSLDPDRQENNRILVMVKIEDVPVEAIVDTGGIYCVLHPFVAEMIGFTPSESIGSASVLIRREKRKGSLYSATLRIIAEQGESLEQRVTVMVPDASVNEWGDLPTFLGLTGCLEFLRFAVDPLANRFYFASA